MSQDVFQILADEPLAHSALAARAQSLASELRLVAETVSGLEPLHESAMDLTADLLDELAALISHTVGIEDAPHLALLIAQTHAEGAPIEHTCIKCGCTDSRACVTNGEACHWSAKYADGTGLCSACE